METLKGVPATWGLPIAPKLNLLSGPGFTVNEPLVPDIEPSVAVIEVELATVEVTDPVRVPPTNAPKFLDPLHEEEVNVGFPV